MIKIAVCDDEKRYLDAAVSLLEAYATAEGLDFEIESFSSSFDLMDRIEGGMIHDVYFLDIFMPGTDGMSVAVEIRGRQIQNPIVFVTSSQDFAVQAFGVDATHYLLKPYAKEDFFLAVAKALRCIQTNMTRMVMLKSNGRNQHIPVKEILYSVSDDNYQRIWMKDGSSVYVRITGGELFEKLCSFGSFFRCGRSLIVNLAQISKIGSGTVVMKNGKSLPVPKLAMSGLKTAYFDYYEQST